MPAERLYFEKPYSPYAWFNINEYIQNNEVIKNKEAAADFVWNHSIDHRDFYKYIEEDVTILTSSANDKVLRQK